MVDIAGRGEYRAANNIDNRATKLRNCDAQKKSREDQVFLELGKEPLGWHWTGDAAEMGSIF